MFWNVLSSSFKVLSEDIFLSGGVMSQCPSRSLCLCVPAVGMEELQVIKKELTLIKTQIDGLLDSLERMDTQKSDHKGETLIQANGGGGSVWNRMMDNPFAHQKHFIPVVRQFQISAWFAPPVTEWFRARAAGSPLAGEHTVPAESLLLPDKSIIFRLVRVF